MRQYESDRETPSRIWSHLEKVLADPDKTNPVNQGGSISGGHIVSSTPEDTQGIQIKHRKYLTRSIFHSFSYPLWWRDKLRLEPLTGADKTRAVITVKLSLQGQTRNNKNSECDTKPHGHLLLLSYRSICI